MTGIPAAYWIALALCLLLLTGCLALILGPELRAWWRDRRHGGSLPEELFRRIR